MSNNQNSTLTSPLSSSTPSISPFGGQAATQQPQQFLGKSPKELLISFYREKNPSKVDEVDKLLAKYAGNEEKLFQNLAAKYKLDPSVFGVSSNPTVPQGFGQASPLGGTNHIGFGAISSSTNSPFGASSIPSSGGFGSITNPPQQTKPFGSNPTTPFGATATNASFGSFASSQSAGGFGGFGSGTPSFGGGSSPFGGPRR